MKLKNILHISVITIYCVSCAESQNGSGNAYSPEHSTSKTITSQSLLAELVEAHVLKTTDKNYVVELGGIQFGVNENGNSLFLVTSKNDAASYEAIKKSLTNVYGECDEDIVEMQCLWNFFKMPAVSPSINLRHLHTEEGGWVVMFYR